MKQCPCLNQYRYKPVHESVWNSVQNRETVNPCLLNAWISTNWCMNQCETVSKTVKQWTLNKLVRESLNAWIITIWCVNQCETVKPWNSELLPAECLNQYKPVHDHCESSETTNPCCLRETIVKISFLRLMYHFLEANLRLMHHSSLTSYNLLLRIRDLEHHELGLDYRPTAPTLVAWSGAGRYIH